MAFIILMTTGRGLPINTVPTAAPKIITSSAGCMRTSSLPCSIRYPATMAPKTTTIPIIANIDGFGQPCTLGQECPCCVTLNHLSVGMWASVSRPGFLPGDVEPLGHPLQRGHQTVHMRVGMSGRAGNAQQVVHFLHGDRKSTRLHSSHT